MTGCAVFGYQQAILEKASERAGTPSKEEERRGAWGMHRHVFAQFSRDLAARTFTHVACNLKVMFSHAWFLESPDDL